MSEQDRLPSIDVRPERPLVDERLSIRITGLPPGLEVVCHAEMEDGFGRHWRAEATFRSDASGVADLATQAPIAGAYDTADAMGLFWAMALDPADAGGPPFPQKDLEPLPTTLTALIAGAPVATARFDRLTVAPDV